MDYPSTQSHSKPLFARTPKPIPAAQPLDYSKQKIREWGIGRQLGADYGLNLAPDFGLYSGTQGIPYGFLAPEKSMDWNLIKFIMKDFAFSFYILPIT